jgi:hypothetical protein
MATLRDLSVVAFSRHLFGIWTSVQVIRTSHIDRDFGKRRFRIRSTGVGGKKVGNVVTNATRLSRPVRTFSSLRLSNSLGLLRQALPDCLHPPMPSWSPMPPTGRAIPKNHCSIRLWQASWRRFWHRTKRRTARFRSSWKTSFGHSLNVGYWRTALSVFAASPAGTVVSSLSPAAAAERSASPIASRRYFISGLTAPVKNPQRMLGCWTGPIGLEHMKSCSAAGRNIRSSPSRAGETPCG